MLIKDFKHVFKTGFFGCIFRGRFIERWMIRFIEKKERTQNFFYGNGISTTFCNNISTTQEKKYFSIEILIFKKIHLQKDRL